MIECKEENFHNDWRRVWCDKTYTSNKIIKIIFDDDNFVETAPEHTFILRDGTSKRADAATS